MEQLIERLLGRPFAMPENGNGGGDASAEPATSGDAQGGDDLAQDDDAPESEEAAEGAEPDDELGEGDEVDGAERKAAPEPVDETDEVDFGYKKFTVNKELKQVIDGFRADVTQKTQLLAEQRKALAAAAEQQSEIAEKRITKLGQLAHAEDMLSRYRQVNWQELHAQDAQNTAEGRPTNLAQIRNVEWTQWRDTRETLLQDVRNLDVQAAEDRDKWALERQQETVGRIQEATMTLHRDIPTWSEDGPKVGEFAKRTYGFTEQELNTMADSRLGKLMRDAWKGAELIQKQKTAAQKAAPVKSASVETAPLVTVAARGNGAGARKSLPDLAKGDDMGAFVKTWEKTYGTSRRR